MCISLASYVIQIVHRSSKTLDLPLLDVIFLNFIYLAFLCDLWIIWCILSDDLCHLHSVTSIWLDSPYKYAESSRCPIYMIKTT